MFSLTPKFEQMSFMEQIKEVNDLTSRNRLLQTKQSSWAILTDIMDISINLVCLQTVLVSRYISISLIKHSMIIYQMNLNRLRNKNMSMTTLLWFLVP